MKNITEMVCSAWRICH